jgi:hypothetical protein
MTKASTARRAVLAGKWRTIAAWSCAASPPLPGSGEALAAEIARQVEERWFATPQSRNLVGLMTKPLQRVLIDGASRRRGSCGPRLCRSRNSIRRDGAFARWPSGADVEQLSLLTTPPRSRLFERNKTCKRIPRGWPYGWPSKRRSAQSRDRHEGGLGGTNAAPIVLTIAGHGYPNGHVVNVAGVTGNTNANGVWEIPKMDANNVALIGSQGNALTSRAARCARRCSLRPSRARASR